MLNPFNFTYRKLAVLEPVPRHDDGYQPEVVTRKNLECVCVAWSDGDVWMCEEHDAEFDSCRCDEGVEVVA